MTLNEFTKTIHQANAKWWTDIHTGQPLVRNKGELIALIHSEISEAYDGEKLGLMDDKLKHRKMGEVECADAVIRIFDYAGGFGYDLEIVALSLFDIGDFPNLNKIFDFSGRRDFPDLDFILNDVRLDGLTAIHSLASALLELERKNQTKEKIERALVVLITSISYYCFLKNYDLHCAIVEKLVFNAEREDHKYEARLKDGGKKF